MSTLESVLQAEKEEILEWIEQMEDTGTVALTEFKWKQYTFQHDLNFIYKVTSDVAEESIDFERWEDAVDYVLEKTLSKYA